ncbi:MAG: hypothetical protein EOM05_00350 [Clostridia bacterium]|nr:hypothetical protein [Clostridia bacterium]
MYVRISHLTTIAGAAVAATASELAPVIMPIVQPYIASAATALGVSGSAIVSIFNQLLNGPIRLPT